MLGATIILLPTAFRSYSRLFLLLIEIETNKLNFVATPKIQNSLCMALKYDTG